MTSDENLSGKVALVTGAGRGLGRAFAEALASAGASVALAARTTSEVDETARRIHKSGGRAVALTADVTDRVAVQRVVEATTRDLGSIDLLVNNAGVPGRLGNDWDATDDEWWQVMTVNVLGPRLFTSAVLPGMMARRSGRIINISSQAAHEVHTRFAAYCASKAALSHWTRVLAASLKPLGIAAFAVEPWAWTAMLEELATSPDMPEATRGRIRAIQEAEGESRLAKSVAMLMFLASGKADSLTGRHVRWKDEPQELLSRADEIVQNELYAVRLHV